MSDRIDMDAKDISLSGAISMIERANDKYIYEEGSKCLQEGFTCTVSINKDPFSFVAVIHKARANDTDMSSPDA